jgi:DnaJ family protein C protein 7
MRHSPIHSKPIHLISPMSAANQNSARKRQRYDSGADLLDPMEAAGFGGMGGGMGGVQIDPEMLFNMMGGMGGMGGGRQGGGGFPGGFSFSTGGGGSPFGGMGGGGGRRGGGYPF